MSFADQLVARVLAAKVRDTPIPVCAGDHQTVDQLRALCKARGLRGYSRLKRADLLCLLETSPTSAAAAAGQKKQSKNQKTTHTTTQREVLRVRVLAADKNLYVHMSSQLVFKETAPDTFVAMGVLTTTPPHTIHPLNAEHIDMCKAMGVQFQLPPALSSSIPDLDMDALADADTDLDADDDDDADKVPDYSEIL